jgi:hypothetical protein
MGKVATMRDVRNAYTFVRKPPIVHLEDRGAEGRIILK